MARDWTSLKKPQAQGNGRDIKRLRTDGPETRVRFVGDVLPRYVYWITTAEGKRMPVECLEFDRESEQFSARNRDPFKEISEAVYDEKPTFSYVCNVIDRKDGEIKLMDLKTTIYKQVIDYAVNPEYGNPSDPDEGYDITIKKEKTGPLPQNVKYTVMPSRNTVPLTEAEKEMDLYNLDTMFKRPTYEEQKEFLLKNTNYFAEGVAVDLNSTETMQDL
jgi:hypothetical protein